MRKEKDRILRVVSEAIDNKQPIVLFADNGEESVFGVQGTDVKLSMLVLKAMKVDKRIFSVFEAAFQTYKKFENPPEIDEFLEWLKNMLGFTPLDCDNCPVAEECEVKDEVHCSKEMPEELKKEIDKLFKKIKED